MALNTENHDLDPAVRKIMKKKKLAQWMNLCGFVLIGIVIFGGAIEMVLGPGLSGNILIFFMILAVPLIFGGDSMRKNALIAQREMGLERTPDEIEEERKRNERVRQLTSSGETVDRELKKLAGWNKILAKMILLGLIFLLADVVVALVFGFFDIESGDAFVVFMSLATIVLLFPTSMLYAKLGKKQKELSLHYTPGVLSEVMDRLDRYDPEGCVEQSYLMEDFAYRGCDRIGRRGDYVKGVLKGMPVEFCEYEIQYEAETTDDDGHRKKEIRTSFSGLMAVCRHGIKLSSPVTMTQFSRYRNEIKTESIEFTRAFSVKEISGHDAFLVLTPQFMEEMMMLIREKRQRMGLQFRTDGTLLIAVQGADFFEADDTENVEALKEKIQNELLDLADIMQRVGALTLEETESSAV